jgi:hypothetical protein
MEKIYNSPLDSRVDVTKYFIEKRTLLVLTLKEAIEKTKYRGYFYEVFNKDKDSIGYGIPK